MHHFADHTKSLYLRKFIKALNKLVNFDLQNLLYQLNASEIPLMFKKRKHFDGEIKPKLSRKRLILTDSLKYLGFKICGYHIDYLLVKLSRANALLFKIRILVNSSILRTTYFAIFESHLSYCSLVCYQNCNAINRFAV